MKTIPQMMRVEEGKFWETHEATDYLDEMESVTVTVGPRPRNRCSACGRTMLSRYVNVDIADGRAQLRGLRELYCPDGHETHLAPEADRLVRAIESVLRLTWQPMIMAQVA